MDTSSTTKLSFPQRLLYPLPLIVFVIVWHLATHDNKERQFIFSSPMQVAEAMERLAKSGELFTNCQVTIMGSASAGTTAPRRS